MRNLTNTRTFTLNNIKLVKRNKEQFIKRFMAPVQGHLVRNVHKIKTGMEATRRFNIGRSIEIIIKQQTMILKY